MPRVTLTNKGLYHVRYNYDLSFMPDGSEDLMDQLREKFFVDVEDFDDLGIDREDFLYLLKDGYVQLDTSERKKPPKWPRKWKGKREWKDRLSFN